MQNVYVLNSLPYPDYTPFHLDGYYTGRTYRVLGEVYAVVDMLLYNAKKYKSQKVAERACAALNDKVCNYRFSVEEVPLNEAFL